jgi:hypothetical protein
VKRVSVFYGTETVLEVPETACGVGNAYGMPGPCLYCTSLLCTGLLSYVSRK